MPRQAQKNKGGTRAVIYARYSSHNQREESVEQQVKKCTEFAERKHLTITDIYADKAISGTTDRRPQFQRMMRDSITGKFDYVIAWKSNRMGRNMQEALVNDGLLRERGVRCLYAEESFDDTAAGRFALRNMMNVNQFYSEAMAEDVRRGMMDNAEKCMVNGRISFGYRKGQDGKFEIMPEEAAIVREIFDRILDDWKFVDIINDLNARGIRTKSGGKWKPSSFNWLIQNEMYVGVYKFGETRIEGGVPAIVDAHTFEEVQRRLKVKGNPRGRHRNSTDYLLTGKIFCGICGSQMVGVSGRSKSGRAYHYYACQKRRAGGCHKKNVAKGAIEQKVIDSVCAMIMDDETLDWIIQGYERFMEQMRQESDLGQMEEELADLKKRTANMVAAIEAGVLTETTKARLVELETQRKELERSIAAEKAALKPVSVDEMRFILEECRDRNIDTLEYQKELIQLFIQAIYVYDDHLKIVVNNKKGGGLIIPFGDIDAIDDGAAKCSSNVRLAVPNSYHTNTTAGITVYLHARGIVLIVPL